MDHSDWKVPKSSAEILPLLPSDHSPAAASTLSIIDTLVSSQLGSSDQAVPTIEDSVFVYPLSPIDLALFNGFINASKDSATPFLRFILPHILRSLSSHRQQILDPYQHLFVLKNGLEKLTKAPVKLRVISTPELKSLSRELETKIVRRYWDSRFSGCPDLAVDCYRAVLHGLEKDPVDIGPLIHRYSDNNRYPWYIRGKYKLLAVLVEFCSLEQLLKCEEQLLNNIGYGLAATHVAPFSSAVYKTVLNVFAQKYRRQEETVLEPLKRWTLAVVDYLVADDRLLAMHASKYWVPAVAKFVPDGCRWILEELTRRRQQAESKLTDRPDFDTFIVESLCNIDLKDLAGDGISTAEPSFASSDGTAWIIWASMLIRRHARRWLREMPPMDDQDWPIGLQHLEDDVRLETFSLLVDVSAKYIPLTPSQYEIAAQFLFDNLIVASSSFRRRLLAAYGKWIKATVDYFAKQLGSPENEAMIHFRRFIVESILIPVFDNLFPGANYQRLTTVLGILQLTLDSLTVHDSLWKFLEIERTITGNRTFGLQMLRCLQNSSEEIRRRSSFFMKNYFKFPFDVSVMDVNVMEDLCRTAASLCCSPKAIDCDTACVIWDVITEKVLLDGPYTVRLDEDGSISIERAESIVSKRIETFVACLLRIMQSDFDKLRSDLRSAAADTPLHGWAQMLSSFLEIIRLKGGDVASSITPSARVELLELACRVIDYMLTALGSPSEGLCPSLAEMQTAIVSTAAINGYDAETENDQEEDPSIPLDEQLVLACCWLNIKTFAAVTAELAAISLSTGDSSDSAISNKIVSQIGFALFDAMSRTRHFGALEACNLAFSKYLRLCMASKLPAVNQIPMQLLEKVLEHVAAPKHVSVTRRAVGFSIMIECIAVAGCAMRKRQYLETAFVRLLSITEIGLNSQLHDRDDKSDVNVVRAMHCLRLLLRSSSLDLDVLPYIDACYRLAVQQFSNTLWSIRNSAMLILSSILWRLFGRREVKQDDENAVHSENRMDLVEFCADFASLWKFFCARLADIATNGCVDVDSRIFALLCFAQNLIVTDINGSEELAKEVNAVIAHLVELQFRTPDSRLKRVIAEVLANFVPKVGSKRQVFFETVRQYVMERNGDELRLNDRMALAHLMTALKLKPEQATNRTEASNTEKITIQNQNDPVQVCRLLKRCLYSSDTDSIDSQLLSFWVDGSGGLSAQCLALPLIIKLQVGRFSMEDVGRDELKKRFLDSAGKILTFAEERQIETRRLAAACSFFFIRPAMKAIHEEDAVDEELGWTNARLLLALLALLSDEDEMVRYVAAGAVTVAGTPTESLSPVLCLKRLFAECADNPSSATSRMVIGKVLGMDDDVASAETLSAISEKADSVCGGEKIFLFAQQDFNIYKEEYFHLRLCVEGLLAQLPSANWSECSTKPAPIELAKLCVAALEKMKSNVHLRRRKEESVFLIALRLLLRRRLLDLTCGVETSVAEYNEVISLLRHSLSHVFRIDDRMCMW